MRAKWVVTPAFYRTSVQQVDNMNHMEKLQFLCKKLLQNTMWQAKGEKTRINTDMDFTGWKTADKSLEIYT